MYQEVANQPIKTTKKKKLQIETWGSCIGTCFQMHHRSYLGCKLRLVLISTSYLVSYRLQGPKELDWNNYPA